MSQERKMEIELIDIPGAQDRDKAIIANGDRVGTVCRGWLRNGGEQWVASLPVVADCSDFGERTLRDLKKAINHKLLSWD